MSPLGSGPLGSTPLGGGGTAAGTTGGGSLPPSVTGATFSVLLETGGFGSGFTVDVTADVTNQTRIVKRGYTSTDPGNLLSAPSMFTFGLDNSASNAAGRMGRYSLDGAARLGGWGIGITRVMYQVTVDGATTVRFVGWVKRIEVTAGLYEDFTVKVTAMSWLWVASNTPVTGLSTQTNQRGDQLVATAIGLVQFPPPAIQLNMTLDVYPYAFWDQDPTSNYVTDAIEAAAGSGLDRCHELADGTIVLENRQFREMGAAANVITLSDVAPSGRPFLAITGLAPYQDVDRVYNGFTVAYNPSRVDPVPVVLYAYQTSGSPAVAIGPFQSLVITGQYVDPAQQAQRVAGINMVDAARGGGAPGFLPTTDYQFVDAAGTDVSALVSVVVVFESLQATFTIQSTVSYTVYIAKLQCRGQGVYNYQGATARQSSATGVAAMSQLTGQITCKYQADPVFARNAASYLVARKSSPQTQIDQGVRVMVAAGAEADMAAILALDISTPIGASETVSGLAGGNYWINAIQEEMDERNNLTWTAFLDARDPNQYWKIGIPGSSEIGQTTFLAPI